VGTNATGSNLEAGLVAALLGSRTGTAVLEVDEVVLPRAIAACRPAVLVLLNLSRDQLDRTSEVQTHANRWADALRTTPAWVVANADDPLVVHAVTQARPGGDRVEWVAAGQPWRADSVLCPSCHQIWDLRPVQWSCRHCGLSRPRATWQLTGDLLRTPTGALLELPIALPGRANLGNAAMAVAAAAALGVAPALSTGRLRRVQSVAGRYSVGVVGGRRLRLLLAKNPAGWAAMLDELDRSDSPVIVAINARGADGLDPSWLWDVPFERLAGRQVVVTGERVLDLATRLRYAEVPLTVSPDLRRAISEVRGSSADIVANYTAFAGAAALLTDRQLVPASNPIGGPPGVVAPQRDLSAVDLGRTE
jgi:UDP-N-acetylmuramyl tripeptide synthase